MTKGQVTITASFAIFVLGHLLATVWWASQITTRQEYMILQLNEVKSVVCKLSESQYGKEDAKRDLALRDDLRGQLTRRIELAESQIHRLLSNNAVTQ